MTSESSRGAIEHVGRFVFVERGQHGGAGERVGAPGVGAFAVVHVGEQIGAADGGADRDAVAQPLAQDDDVGLDAVFVKANSEPVRPKLACTSSRMKMMSCSRQKRASSCRYSFCGWYEPPPPRYGSVIRQQMRLPYSLQRRPSSASYGTRSMWLLAASDADALVVRKADESDPRVALVVVLAAGDGAGQALLAVKAVARGEDDICSPGRGDRARPRALSGSPRCRWRPTSLARSACRRAAFAAGRPAARSPAFRLR